MTQNPKLGAILCICLTLGGGALLCGLAEGSLWGYARTDPAFGEGPLGGGHSEMPPGWLMRRLDPAGQMEPPSPDPSVSIDPSNGHIREIYREGGIETRPPMVTDLDEYSGLLTARTYRRLWRDQSKTSRSVARGTTRPKGLFHAELPIAIPKQLRGILGNGAPSIDVSGSETITLSGVSDWTVRRQDAAQSERRRQSAFPSLEMKQDLQVNLTGSIGDKIKVDVDQSSNVQTSLDNKVKLRYEGDEDDMIKSIDLGNTNLSLQGASIRQEGLFGVKTVAKLGNVDVVTIASKQEGKTETARFTPSGEKRQVRIADLDYIKRQYFLISSTPMVSGVTGWKRETLQVYRDDRSADHTGKTEGVARLNPGAPADSSNPEIPGFFKVLTQGTDFDLILPYDTGSSGTEIPILKMRFPLNVTDVLAVTYVDKSPTGQDIPVGDPNKFLLKAIKPTSDEPATLAGGAYDPSDSWYPTIHYELKNFYDLTARNIAKETLTLKVRRRDNGLSVDPDAIGGRPLLEVLGLDQQGITVDTRPDGRLDDRYVFPEEGVLFFPDLHPFAPGCDTTFPVCFDNMNRNTLRGDSANPNVYYTKNTDFTTQSRYYIEAEFKSSQQGYFLGRFNILENSEQVKVNGIPQTKGSQYTIDYDTGQLTFTAPPGPDDVISVDYSFAPGVGQVQRTLLGFSTSYSPSADLSVTSSMLYESRGAQELNPKLGEEPARSMVGDLASVMTFRPSWMTQFANLLPGVHTSAPSTLNLQGNLAVSMPNPNTKGEAYVDDMEGNRESNTLALGRTTWMWSSIPVDTATGQPISLLVSDHAPIQWYNPHNSGSIVHEQDLKPVLTKEEGGDNERSVLEINMLSPTDSANTFTSVTWTGLTQALSRTGQDLSRTRFVEIWVNDRRQLDHAQTHAKLHIDFGRVSEDALWERNALPNDRLDTEDKNGDTKLDKDEDTGLDGLHNEQEPGFTGANDPNGDDYHYTTGSPDYSGINGTENNSKDDPNGRPDTEDLNLDGHLDKDNDYFEATVDLSDTTYVAVDVARDYPGHPVVTKNPNNGWRLFRIPLDGPAFHTVGRPSWDNIKHARLWLDGMTAPTNLQIAGIELVGSRWLPRPLSDDQRTRQVVLDVKVRNNKDDAGGPVFYNAPFDVPNAVGGNATRREQSLALAYANLSPRDSVFAFKTFSDAGNGAGYTQYRDIRFYVHGDAGVDAQKLSVVARFGPDTVNYYEYSLPVRTGWQDARIPMEILSRLKEASNERVKIDSLTGADIGARYTVVGNPSFTRVNRITFGVTVVDTTAIGAPGEVWIDELRLDGVRKDVGKSGNFVVQGNFGDVLSVSGNYQKQDQDFFRVGTGVNRGSGLNHTALGFSSTLQLDRMLPLTGLELPVTVTVAHATDVPKYRTGSDVVLDRARSDIETRSTDRQSVDFRYRRTGPRKGWTRWTIDAVSGSMRYQREANVDPQFNDSTWTFTTGGNYSIPIGGGKGIPFSKNVRFKYLPDVVSFGADWNSSRHAYYTRYLQGNQDSSALRSNALTRLLTLRTDASYLPIGNSLTTSYHLESRRDMLIHREGFIGNVGTEVGRNQTMTMAWVPRRVLFLNPNISLTGTYREDAGSGVRVNSSDPLGLKNIGNTGSLRATTTIPFSRFANQFKPAGSRRDTSEASPLTAPFRFIFSRFQDIQTTFAFNRAAAVSRVVGSPGFAYLTGFTQKFNPSIYRAPNSNVVQSRSYLTTANTIVAPLNRLTVTVHADHRIDYNDNLAGARRIYTLTWPDLNGSWLQLQQMLGMDEMMSSLVVNSHYSVRSEDQGPAGKPIETHSVTTNWGPLLGWEASFKNGIRANVNTSLARTEALDQRQGGVSRTRTSTTHDIRLTKVYPASKGIRFPWSKRRVKLPNDVNLNLTMGITRDKQETDQPGFPTLVETDIQRLNVGSGTTYNFTPSITGGFDLAFRQTKDYKQDLTQRGITVAVNAQFRF
ncbi:MAG: cell surface protein SprA [Candidatus Eisenbacteria bacterium]|uniref:Cell surface protein SprA n=1 Tax=Eiseniibacteriota bacterium TaxID=2212470 RepID=A0A538T8J4_UNCEI|nr:MAG: cell surface protein SprA [Candidatus Eisenbacteria bacterium]